VTIYLFVPVFSESFYQAQEDDQRKSPALSGAKVSI
jgi:hypothetical protein